VDCETATCRRCGEIDRQLRHDARADVDAVGRDGDAPGRLGRRDRRDDLDRDSVTTPTTAAQLARTGYPAPLRAVAPAPGAAADVHTGAARPALAAQQRAAARSR